MAKIKKFARIKIDSKICYALADGEKFWEIEGDIFKKFKITSLSHPAKKVKILTPAVPSKIIAVGLNYRNHARELKMALPKEPIIFLKAPTAAIGHQEKIKYPASSKEVHYEAELGVIIKKKAKNISPEKAGEVILGYTCANDVTARDLQKKDGQWARAKSFDTFCPFGPFIVTGINPGNLKIELNLNGQLKQNSSTGQMIFKVAELVSFISQIMTLYPGDLILTGTPPGVGPLKKGDQVEVKIEKIGRLTNKIG